MIIKPCRITPRPSIAVRSSSGQVIGWLYWAVTSVSRCGADACVIPYGAYRCRPLPDRLYSSEDLMEMTLAVMAANDKLVKEPK